MTEKIKDMEKTEKENRRMWLKQNEILRMLQNKEVKDKELIKFFENLSKKYYKQWKFSNEKLKLFKIEKYKYGKWEKSNSLVAFFENERVRDELAISEAKTENEEYFANWKVSMRNLNRFLIEKN
jgi:hypothetical protein